MATYRFKVDDLVEYPRKIVSDGEQSMCFVTIGSGSIVGGASLTTINKGHILIGNYTVVGKNVRFVLNENDANGTVCNFKFKIVDNPYVYYRNQIIIGNDVSIGDNVCVMGGVTIGNGSIIHENSVVYNDVPPFSEVAGSPAVIIKKRFSDDIIQKLLKIKWWQWQSEKVAEYSEYLSYPSEFIRRFSNEISPVKDDVGNEDIQELRQKGNRIFLYVLDDRSDISFWQLLIEEYFSKCIPSDKICLVIEIRPDSDEQIVSQVLKKVNEAKKIGLSLIVKKRQSLDLVARDLLRLSDVFITSSAYAMIRYVDYACEYGVKIVSSYDKNVFSCCDTGKRNLKTITPDKEVPSKPWLTIGIPTYNRSKYLRKCLRAIYEQIGSDMRFEVYVSDNASNDDTSEVAEEYSKRYKNFYYYRQEKNIYGKNFRYIWSHAHGRFVLGLGDDDYLSQGSCYYILQAILRNPEVVLLTMKNDKKEYIKPNLRGVSKFVDEISYASTYISALIFNTSYVDIEKIENILNKHGFKYPSFFQTCMALELVSLNRNFTAISKEWFLLGTGEADRFSEVQYNEIGRSVGLSDLGRIFIGEYLEILKLYFAKGLDKRAYKEELKRLLNFILSYTNLSVKKETRWGAMGVLNFYDKYYHNEPYYVEGRLQIESLVKKLDPTIKEMVRENYFESLKKKNLL